jgi:hypothetical protein
MSKNKKPVVPSREARERMMETVLNVLAKRWPEANAEERLVIRLDVATATVKPILDLEIKTYAHIRDRSETFNALCEAFQYELTKFNKDEIEKLFACHLAAKLLEHNH